MKILEEGNLKKSIEEFNIFISEQEDFSAFFQNSTNLDVKSLQQESFKSEVKFFEEVSFVFSVIASIIARPHLLNRKDEIVIRTELAARIDQEGFNKTTKDPKLWKQKGGEIVPEYIYYHEYNDLLRIYENIFIVMLIDILSREIDIYNVFYTSLIKIHEEGKDLSLRSDFSLRGLDLVRRLKKKVRFIKSTRFYKEIKRGGASLKEVHASNILINDRLYNYCYKFYRKIISYTDRNERLRDIRTYYFIYMIQKFKKDGFEYIKHDSFALNRQNHLEVSGVQLENEDFIVEINFHEYDKLSLNVTNKYSSKRVANQNHLLIFNSDFDFANIDHNYSSRYKTTEGLSLWNLYYFDQFKVANNNFSLEEELMNKYISEKLRISKADRKYYQKFCPSCKEEFTEQVKPSLVTCPNCESIYSIYRKKATNYLWFIKLRKID